MGPSTSGITSPALRATTVSPISTPLALNLGGVVHGGQPHRRSGDPTGVMNANGVTRPMRPTSTRMSSSLVCTTSNGYL
jgi:hypothetical protein